MAIGLDGLRALRGAILMMAMRRAYSLGYKSLAPIPEGIKSFRRLAKIGSFPHPSLILKDTPDLVSEAYVLALELRSSESMEADCARRNYLTLLADAVMDDNPLEREKIAFNPDQRGRE